MKKNGNESKVSTASVVYGPKAVLDSLKAAPQSIDSVFIMEGRRKDVGTIIGFCKKNKIPYHFLHPEAMQTKFKENTKGIAARIFGPGFSDPDHLLKEVKQSSFPVAVALDRLQDPGNIGTLARTLLALGAGGLLLPKRQSAFLGEAAMKSSAGAFHSLPVAKVTNLARALDDAKDQGYFIYCTDAGPESKNVYRTEIAFPAVLVLGNEDEGVRPGVRKRCDESLTIPLTGAMESLNVAQAGAMLLGEMYRKLRFGPR